VIVALFVVGVVVPKSAQADGWNKRTLPTFSQDVEVSGTVPAGTHVFQLADPLFSRHVVQVFDQHGGILAMVVTIPTDL
jgi:hypothetical protein